jgi:phospholipase C
VDRPLTRRQVLSGALAAGAAATVAASPLDPLIRHALAAAPRRGHLRDIEHVVILIQENRSFDHYFGAYRGVRGFDDRRNRKAFSQPGFHRHGFDGRLVPFHLDTHGGTAQCQSDITHSWAPQHRSWNRGRMDRFVHEHLRAEGPDVGPLTMGYYTRRDIPFYYALADAFTLCDRYFCSVLGPTDPNRLYSMSATLDPDGRGGGPLLETLVAKRAAYQGRFTWTTMPEQLSARGIEWKVYTDQPGLGELDNVLPFFKAFHTDPALQARGLQPTYPGDFRADVAAGTLPAVSWILGSIVESEHPGFSSAKGGEFLARDLLATLAADPALWAKTALFITWDENGGFFDHVPPPVAPHGTPGEYVSVSNLPGVAHGIRGPIGLGVRVPMLVISPFSRGGRVCSDVFDHTSTLRFLETRFGAEVPNLSRWRRSATGDLTSAFSFGRLDTSLPRLPHLRGVPEVDCTQSATFDVTRNRMPHQEPGRAKRPVR